MSANTNHGKTSSAKREQWTKINNDRKRSSYIEKDGFEKSQSSCSTTEYSSAFHVVQTGSGAHPVSHAMGIGGKAAKA
jgi:hypothetical protein